MNSENSSSIARSTILVGFLLMSFGCAGQFELDIPDEHPARASATRNPIEPAPSPYQQRYPLAIDEAHTAGDSMHETEREIPSESSP